MAKDEVEALMWAITAGIILILSIMMAVACLLVHYNKTGYKSYLADGGYRSRRPRNGARSLAEGEYMSPRTDVISSRHVPLGKRPSTPSYDGHGSPSHSDDEHIYDLPANYETNARQIMAPSVASDSLSGSTSE
ncbi:hypothetical protein Pmani_031746 [Petrolisthes manimaculis]|uniref:Uncharacterized protein n=1 Tax=Petrolisthes manimaculis TaxID=1843537 RepID=A0AAE1NT26_9EUCA|nr:hypothetical protein Pmani_031746 [Petrolisthes manimaculis]